MLNRNTVLKTALTTAPALISIDYGSGACLIILAVDASLLGWGAVLMQLDAEGRRHPVRFLSGLWNDAEKRYDAGKLECRGVLKALKKVRQYLYGIHFCLELDAKTLIAQLQGSATDLPGALVTRWLAWIRQFDFDIVHVPGRRHSAPDGLSRRPPSSFDHPDEDEEELEREIDLAFNLVRIFPNEEIAACVAGCQHRLLPETSGEVNSGSKVPIPTMRVNMVKASAEKEADAKNLPITASSFFDEAAAHLPDDELATLFDLLQLHKEMVEEEEAKLPEASDPALTLREGSQKRQGISSPTKIHKHVRFESSNNSRVKSEKTASSQVPQSGVSCTTSKQGWVSKNGRFGVQDGPREPPASQPVPRKPPGRQSEMRSGVRKEAVKSGSPLPCISSNSARASQSEGGPTSPVPGNSDGASSSSLS